MLNIDKVENGKCWFFLTEEDLATLKHIIRYGQKELQHEFFIRSSLIYWKINDLLDELDINKSLNYNNITQEYYFCLELIYIDYIDRLCLEFQGGFYTPDSEKLNREFAGKVQCYIFPFYQRYKKDFDNVFDELTGSIQPEDFDES